MTPTDSTRLQDDLRTLQPWGKVSRCPLTKKIVTNWPSLRKRTESPTATYSATKLLRELPAQCNLEQSWQRTPTLSTHPVNRCRGQQRERFCMQDLKTCPPAVQTHCFAYRKLKAFPTALWTHCFVHTKFKILFMRSNYALRSIPHLIKVWTVFHPK